MVCIVILYIYIYNHIYYIYIVYIIYYIVYIIYNLSIDNDVYGSITFTCVHICPQKPSILLGKIQIQLHVKVTDSVQYIALGFNNLSESNISKIFKNQIYISVTINIIFHAMYGSI